MDENSNGFILNREIKNGALILTILSTLLYLNGLAFHWGYLSGYGLSSNMFPLNWERALVMGAGSLLLMALSYAIQIFILLACALLLSSLWRSLRRYDWYQRIRHFATRQIDWRIAGFTVPKGFLIFMALMFWLSLLLLITFYYSGKLAQDIARSNRDALKKQLSNGTLITYHDSSGNPAQVNGRIIAESSDFMALYNGSEMLIIPQSRIDVITVTEP